ncbi:MAG: hypothetical protein Q7V57_04240 [Actinomycetota bacterium]|nr:hypothetical protein [Actinomycetota bacterium]
MAVGDDGLRCERAVLRMNGGSRMKRAVMALWPALALLAGGCGEQSRSTTDATELQSTGASTTEGGDSVPAVELLPEGPSETFLLEHFLVHTSPVVVPAGEVLLSVETVSGAGTGAVNGVDLVLESNSGPQRIHADAVSGGWAAAVEAVEGGIRYRFEISTANGIVALPADHEFVTLYVAGHGSFDLGADLSTVAPSRVETFQFGSGDRQIGRSAPRQEGTEGIDSGPGGVVALADGSVAVLDAWNGRVLVVDLDGSTAVIELGALASSDQGAPSYQGFAFADDRQGAYTDGTTVYTVGRNSSTFNSVDLSAAGGMVGNLELHDNNVVARLASGEYRVVGTLDGSAPSGVLDGMPTTVPLNELFDHGIFFFVPGSPIGHLTSGDDELIPVGGASRITSDGGAVLVVVRASDGATIAVRLHTDGSISARQLIDEAGALFVPTSALDGLPAYSVAPDGSTLSVLTCSATECLLQTFALDM